MTTPDSYTDFNVLAAKYNTVVDIDPADLALVMPFLPANIKLEPRMTILSWMRIVQEARAEREFRVRQVAYRLTGDLVQDPAIDSALDAARYQRKVIDSLARKEAEVADHPLFHKVIGATPAKQFSQAMYDDMIKAGIKKA